MRSSLPDTSIELSYGSKIIAGVDEAGRGAMSGPIVAAAVVMDFGKVIAGINDSKKLSLKKRDLLYEEITSHYHWSIGMVSPGKIDEINILQANILACQLAVANLPIVPEIVLIDGNMRFGRDDFISIAQGDTKSISIAAASIVAKVTRDRIMCELDRDYPYYYWCKNFGYGTKDHIAAMRQYGVTEHHRKSFKY